jgi:hypothetical protein
MKKKIVIVALLILFYFFVRVGIEVEIVNTERRKGGLSYC